MEEIWEDIEDYKDLYEISNYGKALMRHGIFKS